jgi:hypothetical protein
LADPFGQRGDRLGRKFLIFARHGVDIFSFGVVDGKNEAAEIGFTRDDDWPEFAALEDELAGIKTEAGLLLLGSVALVAIVGEDRADLLFEELQLGGRRGGGRLGSGGREGEENGADEETDRH